MVSSEGSQRVKAVRCFTGPAPRSKSGAAADLDSLVDEAVRVSMFQSGEPGRVEPHGNESRKQLFEPRGRSECIPKCHVILLVAILRPPYVYAPLHLSFIVQTDRREQP